jgi:catechol-2,3-dioxygenase
VITGICELTLEARDLGELERFYTECVGLDVLSREDDRIWLAIGERGRLGIWSPGEKEFRDRGGEHVHFAFAVEPRTIDEVVAQLRERGVEVEGPVEHDGGDKSAYFRDPEGNVAELWDFYERSGDRQAELAS